MLFVIAPPAVKLWQIFPRVIFVHENHSQTPGTGIQVLVGAPGGKIHVPVVQFQRNIARSMGHVPADNAALEKCVSKCFLYLILVFKFVKTE